LGVGVGVGVEVRGRGMGGTCYGHGLERESGELGLARASVKVTVRG
jgi:hypothetical protein